MLASEIRPGDQFVDNGVVIYTVEMIRAFNDGIVAIVRYATDGGQDRRIFRADAEVPLARPAPEPKPLLPSGWLVANLDSGVTARVAVRANVEQRDVRAVMVALESLAMEQGL